MNGKNSVGIALGSIIGSYYPKLQMIAPMIGMTLVEQSDIIVNFQYLYELIAITLLLAALYKFANTDIFNNLFNENMNHITTFNGMAMSELLKYILANPEVFGPVNQMSGDIETLYRTNSSLYDQNFQKLLAGNTISFNDKALGVVGKIEVKEKRKTVNQENSSMEVDITYYKIYATNNSKYTATEYLKQIYIKNSMDRINSYNVELLYYKVLVDKDLSKVHVVNKYFDGKRSELNIENAFSDVFHSNKRYIINQVNRANKGGSFNAIFHGPPGTGKSSMVYKIAKASQRHIVSIDLSAIRFKHDIYELFYQFSDKNIPIKPSSIVFLLEEFDTVFDYLKKKTELEQLKREIWFKNQNEIENSDDQEASDSSKDKNETDIQTNDSFSSHEFTIRDLLEIVQGPVPIPGQIIIATTNRFSEIQKQCPALFRDGRLKPMLFDYLDSQGVNQLIEHYTGRSDLHIDFNPQLPTPKIIDIVQNAIDMDEIDGIKKQFTKPE